MVKKIQGLALMALAGVSLLGVAFATTPSPKDWSEEYSDRIHAAELVSPLSDNLFGDNISIYDGTVSFGVTDISLAGNNGLAVELRRYYNSHDAASDESEVDGRWGLDLPYLSGVFAAAGTYLNRTAPGYWEPTGRCSGFGPPQPIRANASVSFLAGEYWAGNHLHLPGGGGGELMGKTTDPKLVMPTKTDVTLSPWITRDHWTFSCTPTLQSGEAGEGFIGYAPDGTQYTFDWMALGNYNGIGKNDPVVSGGDDLYMLNRVQARLYPTKIQDRFGNSVTYSWTHLAETSGGLVVSRLSRIQSSDGRRIDLFYDPATGLLTKATAVAALPANNRDWIYQYNGALQVINPDGSQWSYSGNIYTSVPYALIWTRWGSGYRQVPDVGNLADCWSTHKIDTASLYYASTYTITAPSGATATYAFQPVRHGMNNVPYDCNGPDGGQINSNPMTSDVQALVSKTVSGPGLATATTTYSYPAVDTDHPQSFGYQSTISPAIWGEDATPPPHYRTVTVIQPDDSVPANATHLVYTFGNDYGLNEGQLLKEEVKKKGVTYRTTSNYYASDSYAAGQPFAASMGSTGVLHGDEFSASSVRPVKASTITQDGVDFISNTNHFDAFARATNQTRSSSLGYSRTDVTGYFDDLTQWVLGQVRTQTNTDTTPNVVTAHNDFDPATDLPTRTFANGLLQQSMTYNPDGTLNTVADGLQQTTTLSDWYRGVPKTVTHADHTFQTAGVNDWGWVTSVTNENGFKTQYQYDPMGRATKVTYPTGDTPAWTVTTQSFAQVAATEYGLPAGHWKQTVSTGNTRKLIYFDAFLHPVVTREYDNADATGTQRFTRNGYDTMERQIFASYPAAGSNPTAGVHTTYDPLGRPRTSNQDSELSTAVTTDTQYLPGFKTQVTNPRHYTTTTSYQVFDSPDTSRPVLISSPEGVTTTIIRDVFGKPLMVSRTTSGG